METGSTERCTADTFVVVLGCTGTDILGTGDIVLLSKLSSRDRLKTFLESLVLKG